MTSRPRPAGRSRAGLAVALGALTAIGPLTVDLYLPAFPAIAEHFGTSVKTVQLTFPTYLIGLGIGQVFYGQLSDALGRKRPLAAGLLLYIGASLACAFAPSVGALIGLRFLQALGACAGMVIARAVVRDLFAGVEAARFFSLLVLVFGTGPIVAPAIGGQLLLIGDWRVIFLTLAGFAVLCLAIVLWLPETLGRERRRSLSIHSTMSAFGQVLASRSFLAYGLGGSLAGSALITYLSSAPAVLIEQHGVSPQALGFITGGAAVGFVAGSQLVGRLAGRIPLSPMLSRAIACELTAAATFLAVALAGGGLAALLPPLFVMVFSIGCVIPTATALAVTPFPHVAGTASSLYGVAQTGTSALAVLTVTSLGLNPAVSMGVVTVALCALSASVLTFARPSGRTSGPAVAAGLLGDARPRTAASDEVVPRAVDT